MKLVFYIFVGYAFLGYLYYPSQYSFFSLCLIFFYSLPLLISGILTKDQIYSKYLIVKPLIFWVVIILGFVNLSIIANSTNYSFLDIFSLEGVINIAQKSTELRYNSYAIVHSGNPILLALTLWLIFRVGTTTRLIKVYLQILSFLPLFLYTLLTTEKWPTFLGITFFITGIILANEKKSYIKILKSKIKYAVIIVFIMVLSMIFRGFNGSIYNVSDMIFHYIFAQYNSLGYWYLEMEITDLSFGKNTFIGPLNFLKIVGRDAGVFKEVVELNGMESNIYTAFRYLIQDFGIFGPFFINLSISIFYVITFFINKYNSLNSITKGFMIFTALLSMNTTPFVHNSVMFGMIICLLSDFYTKKELTYNSKT